MTILDRLQRAGRALASIARGDSWVNLATGQGQGTGRSAWEFQRGALVPYQTLSDCYHGDPFAAKVCEAHPEHALRRGFTVSTGTPDVDALVSAACDDLGLTERAARAWTWARAFGGGAIVLGLDDGQRPEMPVAPESLRRVAFAVDVDASELIPHAWEMDPRSPRFGEPLVYRLQRVSSGGGVDNGLVHFTRVVRFEGLPTTRQERQRLQGWGASVLARVMALLEQWNGGHVAVNDLLLDASQGVWKVKGLLDIIAGDAGELFKRRMELADAVRAANRAILLDTEEDFTRTEVGALTGLPDLLDRYALRVAGASGIPVSILLGRSPAGLNATGESDTRGFYDDVSAKRERYLRPQLERVIRFLLLASEGPTRGVEPEGWKVTFPPLWEPTSKEKGEQEKAEAETDEIRIRSGVLTPEEVAAARFDPQGPRPITVDLAAREEPAGVTGDPAQADAVAGIVAKVAARELPRDTGVAMLVDLLGADAATAERLMGESGRTFFTAPDPTAVAGLDEAMARAKKAEASVRGHKAFTARVIEAAKAGGLQLGAFTARAPTEVDEGDVLEEGDAVAVPVPVPEEPAPDEATAEREPGTKGAV